MHEPNNAIKITIQEGVAKNYIDGFKNTLGGDLKGNTLLIDKGPVSMQMSYYSIEGVEFTFASFTSTKPLILTREPDRNPELIHLNLIKEGHFSRSYESELTEMEAGSNRGVFLYNGLFPVESNFPAGVNIKWMGFKFNPKEIGVIYDDVAEIYGGLFEGKDPLAYHSNLSTETERLISDLFSFDDIPHGKVPLISSRAIEIFTNLALGFKKEADKDELLGLHIDDYNTLLKIKNKILANLEKAHTIDELSQEFGISRTKLKQDFKLLFGNSIYQFYTHARMDEAYRRLRSGQYTVSEVGYDMGYSSLSKFSGMFKKVKGLLPTEVEKG